MTLTTLHLVRHARASASSADYDRLHAQGLTQARLLGEWLGGRRAHFDGVFVGPLERQQHTLSLAREAAAERGVRWPPEIMLEGLAEAPYELIVKEHTLSRLPGDHALEALLGKLHLATGDEREAVMMEIFQHMVAAWQRGEVAGVESPPAFHERVAGALEAILDGRSAGTQVMVMTSHGVIGAMLEQLAAEPQGGRLRFANTSITRVTLDGRRVTRVDANLTEHLPDTALRTLL